MTRQTLEEVGFVGVNAEMVKLHLRLGPREREGAIEGRRVVMFVGQVERFAARGATSVQNAIRAVAPGASLMRRRRLKIGSSTAPAVLESGRPSITATGVRIPRPRPRKRARSVSNCGRAHDLAFHHCDMRRPELMVGGRPRRRVARIAPLSATNSVCTNRLEKAGWAASAASGANTTSAYEVSSISRTPVPRLEIEIRRTSASSSGDTAISILVSIIPSRLTISARSSKNAAS